MRCEECGQRPALDVPANSEIFHDRWLCAQCESVACPACGRIGREMHPRYDYGTPTELRIEWCVDCLDSVAVPS